MAVVVIGLSLIRVAAWRVTRDKVPSHSTYLKQLKSPDKGKKLEALYTVGVLGLKEAVPVLVETLEKEPDLQVRRVSAYSLGKIDKGRLVQCLDQESPEVKAVVIETLMTLDKQNLAVLMEKMPEQDTATRFKILAYLETLKTPGYENQLLDLAEKTGESMELRARCLEILKTIGTAEIEGRLLKISYEDPDEGIRKLAREVIKAIREVKK